MSVTFRSYEDLLAHLAIFIASHQCCLIAVEGFGGSGKTCLARRLSADLSVPTISTDDFVIRRSGNCAYVNRLDLARLAAELSRTMGQGAPVLIEGICLRGVLDRVQQRPDLNIYVKRLAGAVWHDGFHLEEFESGEGSEEDREEPHRSDFCYHSKIRPHEMADVIFERVENSD